ncbi:MAG: glycosyltransferase family 4 protein [bacterium]
MRVLMFGWEFHPHNSGGLGMACLGLTRALTKQGVEITFVLPKKLEGYSNNLKIIFPDNKLDFFNFSFVDSLLYPYVNEEQYLKLFTSSLETNIYGKNLFEEVLRYAFLARGIAKREKFDIIHAHDWLTFKAGVVAKDASKKKLIIHVHSTEFDRTGGNGVNQRVYDIEKEGMERADGIIAVSNFTKNIIINRYNIPSKKIEVIHNSVDINDYEINEGMDILPLKKLGYKLVTFVGRITLQKGLDYFLYAAKIISEHIKKVKFAVVGSGDMERQMIIETAKLGISDKVIFSGFLRGGELSRIYKSSDLFIMPSVSEPFGLTALEAILHETPVLISKQSGVSESLSHALKVDFWDTNEIANQAISALRYNSMRRCLRDYSKEEIKRYSWNEAALKCKAMYQNI